MIPQAVTDAHVHLWQPGKLRYDWLEWLPSLNRNCLEKDLLFRDTANRIYRI